MDPLYAKEYARIFRSHWWFRAREAQLRDVLASCELPPGARIVDIGCGDALAFPMLEEFGEVWGLEVDEDVFSTDGPYRHRISTAPLGDSFHPRQHYDLVVGFDVLEHIEDDRAAVESICQLLRPRGLLIFTVPASQRLWTGHDDLNRHYRRYSPGGLRQALAPRFEILELRYLFHLLALPKLLLAAKERLASRASRQEAATALPAVPPAVLSRWLAGVFILEGKLGRRLRPPFGSSLLAVGRLR